MEKCGTDEKTPDPIRGDEIGSEACADGNIFLPPEADYRGLTVNQGISAHLLDNRLLLFSQQAQTLHELNDTAAFLWLSFTDGVHPFQTARELAETCHIAVERAFADMACTFSHWASLGLVHDAAPQGVFQAMQQEENEESVPSPAPRGAVEDFGSRHCFVMAGHSFHIRFSEPGQEDAVWPVFSHLQVHRSTADSLIDIVRDSGGHTVLIDGIVAGTCSTVREIGPIASQKALVVACSNTDSLITIHAGVVAQGGRCILMPGPSGAGKTTLTAGLVSAGFRYFTDEIAVVQRTTGRVIPCPAGLRVKDGSWDAVTKAFRGVVSYCSTTTVDGTRIRYLTPPPGSFPLDVCESLPVGAIVFPLYNPHESTELRSISRVEALRGIQDSGYAFRNELDLERIDELVRWMAGIRCFTLVYASLAEGVTAMRGVLC